MKLHRFFAIFLLLTAVWGFSACTAVLRQPEVPAVFEYEAQYTFGDFSFACEVKKEENTVTVIPTDTNAAGMTIACDGETVTFTQNGMTKSFAKDSLDVTNPARMLWEVLDCVCSGSAESTAEEALTVYSGSCSAGSFTLSQNADGSWNTLQLPSAGITVLFH